MECGISDRCYSIRYTIMFDIYRDRDLLILVRYDQTPYRCSIVLIIQIIDQKIFLNIVMNYCICILTIAKYKKERDRQDRQYKNRDSGYLLFRIRCARNDGRQITIRKKKLSFNNGFLLLTARNSILKYISCFSQNNYLTFALSKDTMNQSYISESRCPTYINASIWEIGLLHFAKTSHTLSSRLADRSEKELAKRIYVGERTRSSAVYSEIPIYSSYGDLSFR